MWLQNILYLLFVYVRFLLFIFCIILTSQVYPGGGSSPDPPMTYILETWRLMTHQQVFLEEVKPLGQTQLIYFCENCKTYRESSQSNTILNTYMIVFVSFQYSLKNIFVSKKQKWYIGDVCMQSGLLLFS